MTPENLHWTAGNAIGTLNEQVEKYPRPLVFYILHALTGELLLKREFKEVA